MSETAPTTPPVSATSLLATARDEVTTFLMAQKAFTADAQASLDALVAKLQPDLEAQLAAAALGNAGALINLDMLRGQAAAGAATIALAAIQAEQAATSAAVTSILMAAIKVGISAAAAAI